MKIGNPIWTEIPKDSKGNEDWSRSRNGGNYAFGYREIEIDGEVIGRLHATSSGLAFCELTGIFTDCELIEVTGTSTKFYADKGLGIEPFISLDFFKGLIAGKGLIPG